MDYKEMCKRNIKKLSRTLSCAGVFFLAILPFFANKTIKKEQNSPQYEKIVAYFQENANNENPFGWEKISAYTTYFDQNEGGRCENIAIAAALIDGIVIQAYGEFSFNQTVGKRTKEAGFQQAKIIIDGEYVVGVGGGVCQVSTTLYNAALKSGLEVTEYHPHSLRVGYVAPSRDAMVSGGSDLKLFNPHPFPVYLSAKTQKGGVKVTFFGKNQGFRYEICERILEKIPSPPPIVKEGTAEEVLRAPIEGIRSEMYLERYRGEVLLSRKRLRTDEYRPVQGIIVKKNEK